MAKKKGLYANIHAKRKRIAAGSGEKMRKVGSKGAPTAKAFKQSAKTAKLSNSNRRTEKPQFVRFIETTTIDSTQKMKVGLCEPGLNLPIVRTAT